MDNYKSVSAFTENEIVIEKSRFIGYATPAVSEEEARDFIAKIKKSHPFATHNCYAYIAENGAIARFSDDGEPQGTAGAPILEVLKNKGLINSAIVVTRYFGGIKLGAGGLVRAYSLSASEVVKKAGEDEFILSDIFSLSFPYDRYGGFLKFKEAFKHKAISVEFNEGVSVLVAAPKNSDFKEKAVDFFAGKTDIIKKSEEFINYAR